MTYEEEHTKVTVQLPRRLIHFFRAFMDEEELQAYLEDALIESIKSDLGNADFCAELVKSALRKHGLEPKEWTI